MAIIGKCKQCGIERRMHRDHIIPKFAGGPDEPSNTQLLCANCHEDKTVEDRRTYALSPETHARLSAANKRRFENPAERAKMSAANKRRWESPEARAKMSETQKSRVLGPEARAKMSAAHKGKPWSAARRRACRTKPPGFIP